MTERDFRDAREWYVGYSKQPPVKKTKTQNLVWTLSRESVEDPECGEATQVQHQPEVDIRREEVVEEVGKRLTRVDFLIGTQESCDQTPTSSQLTMPRFTTV